MVCRHMRCVPFLTQKVLHFCFVLCVLEVDVYVKTTVVVGYKSNSLEGDAGTIFYSIPTTKSQGKSPHRLQAALVLQAWCCQIALPLIFLLAALLTMRFAGIGNYQAQRKKGSILGWRL